MSQHENNALLHGVVCDLMMRGMNELGTFTLPNLSIYVLVELGENNNFAKLTNEEGLELVATLFKKHFDKQPNVKVRASFQTNELGSEWFVDCTAADVNDLVNRIIATGSYSVIGPAEKAAEQLLLANNCITASDYPDGKKQFVELNYNSLTTSRWVTISLREAFEIEDKSEQSIHPSAVKVAYTVFGTTLTRDEFVKLKKTVDFLMKEGPVVGENFKVRVVIGDVELDRKELVQLKEIIEKQTSLL